VVPPDTPVTEPEPEPIVATPGVPLIQVPPPPSVNVTEDPTHTLPGPEIDDGNIFTVSIAVLIQPVGRVYVIVVLPAIPVVTVPDDDPIVATLVLLLVQVPPVIASVNVVVAPPAHKLSVPPITAGSGFTVNGVDTWQPVPGNV
jgi:hypothetical protein